MLGGGKGATSYKSVKILTMIPVKLNILRMVCNIDVLNTNLANFVGRVCIYGLHPYSTPTFRLFLFKRELLFEII